MFATGPSLLRTSCAFARTAYAYALSALERCVTRVCFGKDYDDGDGPLLFRTMKFVYRPRDPSPYACTYVRTSGRPRMIFCLYDSLLQVRMHRAITGGSWITSLLATVDNRKKEKEDSEGQPRDLSMFAYDYAWKGRNMSVLLKTRSSKAPPVQRITPEHYCKLVAFFADVDLSDFVSRLSAGFRESSKPEVENGDSALFLPLCMSDFLILARAYGYVDDHAVMRVFASRPHRQCLHVLDLDSFQEYVLSHEDDYGFKFLRGGNTSNSSKTD